ncbi:MAG: hypothetical protein IIY21_04860 [Clostridiales bacterium]|jgi:hypothetical protein|nr:hypothetical protein [Clostridiales bacterium]
MEVKIPFTKMTAEELFVVPTGGNGPDQPSGTCGRVQKGIICVSII